MKWFNLKQNKCPQCGKDLEFTDGIHCGCGFRISEQRYKEITSDMAKKSVDSYFRQRGEQNLYDDSNY